MDAGFTQVDDDEENDYRYDWNRDDPNGSNSGGGSGNGAPKSSDACTPQSAEYHEYDLEDIGDLDELDDAAGMHPHPHLQPPQVLESFYSCTQVGPEEFPIAEEEDEGEEGEEPAGGYAYSSPVNTNNRNYFSIGMSGHSHELEHTGLEGLEGLEPSDFLSPNGQGVGSQHEPAIDERHQIEQTNRASIERNGAPANGLELAYFLTSTEISPLRAIDVAISDSIQVAQSGLAVPRATTFSQDSNPQVTLASQPCEDIATEFISNCEAVRGFGEQQRLDLVSDDVIVADAPIHVAPQSDHLAASSQLPTSKPSADGHSYELAVHECAEGLPLDRLSVTINRGETHENEFAVEDEVEVYEDFDLVVSQSQQSQQFPPQAVTLATSTALGANDSRPFEVAAICESAFETEQKYEREIENEVTGAKVGNQDGNEHGDDMADNNNLNLVVSQSQSQQVPRKPIVPRYGLSPASGDHCVDGAVKIINAINHSDRIEHESEASDIDKDEFDNADVMPVLDLVVSQSQESAAVDPTNGLNGSFTSSHPRSDAVSCATTQLPSPFVSGSLAVPLPEVGALPRSTVATARMGTLFTSQDSIASLVILDSSQSTQLLPEADSKSATQPAPTLLDTEFSVSERARETEPSPPVDPAVTLSSQQALYNPKDTPLSTSPYAHSHMTFDEPSTSTNNMAETSAAVAVTAVAMSPFVPPSAMKKPRPVDMDAEGHPTIDSSMKKRVHYRCEVEKDTATTAPETRDYNASERRKSDDDGWLSTRAHQGPSSSTFGVTVSSKTARNSQKADDVVAASSPRIEENGALSQNISDHENIDGDQEVLEPAATTAYYGNNSSSSLTQNTSMAVAMLISLTDSVEQTSLIPLIGKEYDQTIPPQQPSLSTTITGAASIPGNSSNVVSGRKQRISLVSALKNSPKTPDAAALSGGAESSDTFETGSGGSRRTGKRKFGGNSAAAVIASTTNNANVSIAQEPHVKPTAETLTFAKTPKPKQSNGDSTTAINDETSTLIVDNSKKPTDDVFDFIGSANGPDDDDSDDGVDECINKKKKLTKLVKRSDLARTAGQQHKRLPRQETDEAEWTSSDDNPSPARPLRTTGTAATTTDSKPPRHVVPVVKPIASDLSSFGIPSGVTLKNCGHWAELWQLLQEEGWQWKKGSGLISYYYIRPDKTHRPPHVDGQDYFTLEDSVMSFVEDKIRLYGPKELQAPLPPPMAINGKRKVSSKRDESDSEGMEDAEPAGDRSHHNSNNISKGPKSKSSKSMNSSAAANLNRDLDNGNGKGRKKYPFHVDDPEVYKDLVKDIDRLDWKAIWQRLRSYGWRFDYEKPSANTWFLAPGQDVNTAVAGKGKFAKSDQVCAMLKTQFPVKRIPDSRIEETQDWINDKQKASEKLQHWELAGNRKQRPPAPNSKYMTDEYTQRIDVDDVHNSYWGPSLNIARGNSVNGRLTTNQSHTNNNSRVVTQNKTRMNNVKVQSVHIEEQSTQAQSPQGSRTGAPAVTTVVPVNHQYSDRISNTLKRKVDCGPIFKGMQFLISGVTEDRVALVKLLKCHGGKMVGDEGQSKMHTSSGTTTSSSSAASDIYIMIGSSLAYRRVHFLSALIAGNPRIHLAWVKCSIEAGRVLPLESFQLPCGPSHFSPFYVMEQSSVAGRQLLSKSPVSPHTPMKIPRHGIFAGKRFLILADHNWESFVKRTGGYVVVKSSALLTALVTGKGIGGQVDYIVFDPFVFSESCIKLKNPNYIHTAALRSPSPASMSAKATAARRNSTNNSATNEFELMNQEEVDMLKAVHRRNSSLGCAVGGVELANVEWVRDCLVHGVLLNPRDSLADKEKAFNLPTEQNPLVHKVPVKDNSASGLSYVMAGDRFWVNDIVNYTDNASVTAAEKGDGTLPSSSLLVGRIESFSKRGQYTCAKVRPFYQDAVKTYFDDDNGLGTNRNGSSNSEEFVVTHITPAAGQSVMIDVNLICGKVVVLSQRDFTRLTYCKTDRHVYCASTEWESTEEAMASGDLQYDDDEYHGYIAMSQDI